MTTAGPHPSLDEIAAAAAQEARWHRRPTCWPTSCRPWWPRWRPAPAGPARPRCVPGRRPRAAARGVALRALVDLYLSAAWRLWRELPAVARAAQDPAAVVRAGEVMLRAADDAVAVLTEGYQLARRDLVAAQAGGPPRIRRRPAARRRAGAAPGWSSGPGLFGLSLAGPHAVVVVRADKPFTDSSPLTAHAGAVDSGQQGRRRRPGHHQGRRRWW